MDTGHWIVNATLSKLFKTFSSSNSGVSCWTSVPSWNRAGRLILPEPSCTISVLHRYLHSHLLHQASALFHTRSRPTFFLPRKEFDQPGLFGHRITCRRQPPFKCSIKRYQSKGEREDINWKKFTFGYFCHTRKALFLTFEKREPTCTNWGGGWGFR